MDELDISGTRYISTRRAGKEHGYHSDYIGQLIRGGKVVGQKVGRAWYVDARSLAEYLGKEYIAPATSAAEVLVPEMPTPKPVTEEPVEILPPVAEVVRNVQTEPVVAEQPVEAVVVETEKKEEIKKFDDAQPSEKDEEYVVPVHITKPVAATILEEKKPAGTGLVYVADDVPSLPRVRTSEYDTQSLSAQAPMAEAAVAFAPQKKYNSGALVALASAVACAVVLGAGVAAYVTSSIQVVGETATVYYSLGQ